MLEHIISSNYCLLSVKFYINWNFKIRYKDKNTKDCLKWIPWRNKRDSNNIILFLTWVIYYRWLNQRKKNQIKHYI